VRRRIMATFAAVALLAASACTSKGSDNPGNGAVQVEFVTVQQPTETIPTILQSLMDEFAKTHPGSSLKLTYVPQDQLDQKLQLLSAQDALPEMFFAPGTPAAQTDMAKSGKALNLEDALTKLGVFDKMDPTAAQIMRNQQGGKVYALPFELNIEGFWYNKKIFSDNGLQPPKSWDDLLATAATLKGKGIQPFSASGIQGWPLTRLVSGYLFRSLGPDALQKVASGQAKLTDPNYVKAAQAVADLGAKGYFGPGFATLDYSPAVDEFIQGKAAMFYMGSWAIGDYNDATRNTMGGPTNIGYFPFPTVSGGTGSVDQIPMNAGLPVMMSAKKYNANSAMADWLKYVAQNYGNTAMSLKGAISGFPASTTPTNLPATTTLVTSQIKAAKQPLGWFESLMSAKAQDVAQKNAAGLANGSVSPADFMSKVQTALAG
jgi:raffinose/stachyose/melibiose transport system substrate-binding protein